MAAPRIEIGQHWLTRAQCDVLLILAEARDHGMRTFAGDELTYREICRRRADLGKPRTAKWAIGHLRMARLIVSPVTWLMIDGHPQQTWRITDEGLRVATYLRGIA